MPDIVDLEYAVSAAEGAIAYARNRTQYLKARDALLIAETTLEQAKENISAT